jgi:hypothetical protein
LSKIRTLDWHTVSTVFWYHLPILRDPKGDISVKLTVVYLGPYLLHSWLSSLWRYICPTYIVVKDPRSYQCFSPLSLFINCVNEQISIIPLEKPGSRFKAELFSSSSSTSTGISSTSGICSTRNWSLVLARQVLYHLSHATSSLAFSLFFRSDFVLTLPGLQWNCHLPTSIS